MPQTSVESKQTKTKVLIKTKTKVMVTRREGVGEWVNMVKGNRVNNIVKVCMMTDDH